jgi:hypothetical protein
MKLQESLRNERGKESTGGETEGKDMMENEVWSYNGIE